ncbi:MAG TPA: putative baseplate assembly protein [Thermoanaerobaculia bacterium]|nr:putative baseplate assembly protein [Thermoanaerobaculia bacterium]
MDAPPKPELCGCCETAASPTPVAVDNRPGLSAAAYRIGTFASFREAMLRALAREPALAGLTTRASDDPAIALLELWAAVGDVLSFYQERIANEAWLRTAVHRDSVLRLVRLLDYHLRPGLAASTRLAFAAEAGAKVRIPVGLRVMSTPGQDEKPQIFETIEAITADYRLNRLPVLPPPFEVNPLAQKRQTAFLASDTAGWQAAKTLAPKDKVVLFGGTAGPAVEPPAFRTYGEIVGWRVPDRVTIERVAWGPPVDIVRELEFWADRSATQFLAPALPADSDAPEEKEVQEVRIEGDRFVLVWTRPVVKTVWTAATEARVYREKMRLFGHDAPAAYATVTPGANPEIPPTWAHKDTPFELDVSGSTPLPLDRVYKDLATGDELMIYEQGKAPVMAQVTGVSQGEQILGTDASVSGSLADHRPRGTVTRVALSQTLSIGDLRKVQVYWLKGPAIPLWNGDFPGFLTGGSVYVPAVPQGDGDVVEIGRTISGRELVAGVAIRPTDVAPGRQVLLTDHSGQPVAAVVTGSSLDGGVDPGKKQLFLRIDLTSLSPIALEAHSAVLLGNVAAATHGETVRGEILGDGDASTPFQRFAPRKKPLTYVPSAKTVRGESALTVLANGERWSEVASLYGQPSTGRVFTARQDDDGTTVLQFGDGGSGARLPSGRGNVTATYRQGSGLAGRLAAEQLNILLDRPVGLKAAANPAPTEGGADPEVLERARQAAPATVKTFGRAVSLLDFELLVLASGEIAKARATWVWDGLEKGVHLTVAGQRGGIFSPQELKLLHSALTRQRDPNHPLLLANVGRIPVVVQAAITVDDDFVRAGVLKAARAALLAAFDFDAVDFAAPVHLSDVYQVLQDVPGVSHLDVEELQFKGYADWTDEQRAARGATAAPVQPHLRIFAARPLAGSSAAHDPFVVQRFGDSPPRVLPAEQAYFEDPAHDAVLSAEGGLA